MRSLFNDNDKDIVNQINNDYYSEYPQHKPTPNNLTHTLDKYIKNKQFRKFELTPYSFAYLASVYLERSKTAKEVLQIPRGVIRGNALQIEKRRVTTINDFAQELGISMKELKELSKSNEYRITLEVLNDGLASGIMNDAFNNSIKENIAIKYLVNYTDFKDVSQIEHIDTTKVLPSFMQKNIANDIKPVKRIDNE